MRFINFKILAAMSALFLAGCEVDPLNTQVQNPSHRAAFQAAAGAAPSNQTLRVGQPVRFVISDAGYDGSGQATDISNFRPVNAVTCAGSSCPAINAAAFSECRVLTGGATACTERNSGAVDKFTFYPDQRLSVDVASQGKFWSGVWYQTPAQRRRAASVYNRMMQGFIAAYGPSYARVADERAATIDAIADAGAAAAAISGQSVPRQSAPQVPVAPPTASGSVPACLEVTRSPNPFNVNGPGNPDLDILNRCGYPLVCKARWFSQTEGRVKTIEYPVRRYHDGTGRVVELLSCTRDDNGDWD